MTGDRVVVYDPNGINPYGTELACLLAETGFEVRAFAARDVEWKPAVLCVRAVLPASAGGRGRISQSFDWVMGPMRAAWAAWWFGRVLVLVWTRGAWDEWLFSQLARFVPTLVLLHNPAGRERLSSSRATSRARLLARATPVVHSELLLDHLPPEQRPRYRAVQHLPYVRWRGWVGSCRTSPPPGSPLSPTRILLLGAPRPDKGLAGLPDLIAGLDPQEFRVAVAGKGDLRAWLGASLDQPGGPGVADLTSTSFLTAAELASCLDAADVLIAPYSAATQSGTVALALTWGLGVVAYGSGGLGDLLAEQSVVPAGEMDSFVDRLVSYRKDPWRSGRASLSEWRAMAQQQWVDALFLAGARPMKPNAAPVTGERAKAS